MAMRLGMLGTWHVHAEGMVRQIATHPEEFHLVGCYDADPQVRNDRQALWASHGSSLRFFDNPADLMKLGLDGVLVEGQVFDNLRLARLALEHGLPVLLEKPAGVRLDEFRALAEEASARGLHLQMAYLFRYVAPIQKMLQLGSSGALGQIYHYRARLPKELATYESLAKDLRPYPGGVFFEMAGHLVDFMVTLLGPPKSITPFLGHHGQASGNYRDNTLAIFAYDHAWASIEVTNLEVAPFARRIEVFGTQGAAVLPHLGSGHLANRPMQALEVFQDGMSDWQRLEFPATTLQLGDLREFAACVGRDKRPDYSLEHDLLVQEVLLSACGMYGGRR